jgi:hypothetical protein
LLLSDLGTKMSISVNPQALPPARKLGWLKKQSRTGMLRNWKQRFVVLELGVITYYEKKLAQDVAPYGELEKGYLHLKGASIVLKRNDGANRIYIECGDAQADILLEAESAADAASWASAINEHIIYAGNNATVRKGPSFRPSISEFNDGGMGPSRSRSMYVGREKEDSPRAGSGESEPEVVGSNATGDGGYMISPSPG